MGISQSILGNVGLQSEGDEGLVHLNEDIFDKVIIKQYLKAYKRFLNKYIANPDGIGQTFSDSNMNVVIDSANVEKLMQDITGLHDSDPKGNAFTEEMRQRQHVITQIHDAVRRETFALASVPRPRSLS